MLWFCCNIVSCHCVADDGGQNVLFYNALCALQLYVHQKRFRTLLLLPFTSHQISKHFCVDYIMLSLIQNGTKPFWIKLSVLQSTQALQKYTLTSSSSSPSPAVNHHHHGHVHHYLQVYTEHPSWHNKPLLSLSFQYQLVRLGRHQTWDGELPSVSGNIWNIATSQRLSVGSIKTP